MSLTLCRHQTVERSCSTTALTAPIMKLLSTILCMCIASQAEAYIGFDGIQAMSVNAFNCLQNQGFSFYVTRVWQEIGDYDFTGIQNIKNARAAGWNDVDGYIYPCRRSTCASAAHQMEATIDQLGRSGAQIGMIWLDIERDSEWSSNLGVNQQLIRDLVNQAQSQGVKVGIYTNNNNWAAIVGIDWSEFSSLPLWWANYNGQQNYDGFVPFGGWSRPAIRQYQGDVAGPCGVSMDLNWYP